MDGRLDRGDLTPMERVGAATGVAVTVLLAGVLPGLGVSGVDLAAGPLGVALSPDAAVFVAGPVALAVGTLAGAAAPSVTERTGVSPRSLVRAVAAGPLAALSLALLALAVAKAAVALGDGVVAAFVALVAGLLGVVYAGAGLGAFVAAFVVSPTVVGLYAGLWVRRRAERWPDPPAGEAAVDRTPRALARAALLGRPRAAGPSVSARAVGWWAGVATTVLFVVPLFVGPLRAFAVGPDRMLVQVGSAVPGVAVGSAVAFAVGLVVGNRYRATVSRRPSSYRTRLASMVVAAPVSLALAATVVAVGAPVFGDLLAAGVRTAVARLITAGTIGVFTGGGVAIGVSVLVGLPTVAGAVAGDLLAAATDGVRA